jgi:MFS family permease
MAGAVALLAYSSVPATALLILVLIGMLDATTEVSYSTIIQRAFPARHLTAIMTVASAFISGGMVAGFAAAAAGEQFAPQASLLLPAAGCGLAALLALPLARQRRTAADPEALPNTLARGLLQLPALVETATGHRVAVVAEEHGRWLVYPAGALQHDADLRLRLDGFELAARPVATADHDGAWIAVTGVNRVRRAA